MNKLRLSIVLIVTFLAVHVANVELLAQDQQQNQLLVENNSTGNILQWDTDQVPLADLLSRLEEKFSATFLYDHKSVANKFVSRSKAGLSENPGPDLSRILQELGLSYDEIHEGIFLLMPSQMPLDKAALLQTVSGTVTDAQSGETLPGVNVLVKGTSTGTSTGSDGSFELNVESLQDTLVFSFVGYQTQEVPVNGRTEIEVALQSQAIAGEELVVVGYGTQQRRDLTGSVSSVSAEDLDEAASSTSIEQGLVGKIAGVNVTQTSGRPGSSVSVRIRGSSSIQGGNEPLYIIDGFPVYSEGEGPGGRLGALNMLNPQDIESIEFLKDASATAIYGSRASNGVVLITTKGGQQTRDEVSFNISSGIKQITRKIPVMDALEYAQLTNQAYTNDGLNPYYDEAEMEHIREIDPGTDWQDEIYRDAPTQNYNLRFSGGAENYTYSISGNYTDEDGIIKNSDYKRYSGRININRYISDKFTIIANFDLNNISSNFIAEGSGRNDVPTSALLMSPILPVYQDDMKTEYTLENTPGRNVPNPVATINEITDEYSTLRALGKLQGQYNITPNLTADVKMGVDLQNSRNDNFVPANIAQGGGTSSGSINESETLNWLNENTLQWNTALNEDHSLDLLGGFTMQKNIFRSSYASAQEFPTDRLGTNDLSMASVYNQPNSNRTEWTMVSYLGRINYNIMDRYLFTVTGRIDGSSRFGKENKYGYFPSGAFAWRLGDEQFIDDLNIFSELKLRISYGITGNQEIGLYNSLSTLGTSSYSFGDGIVTGVTPNKMPNPDLKWELSSQMDIGLDMEFFNNRLRITADYYDKTTSNLLYNVGIPYTSGFSTALQNIAELNNKGFDLELEGDVSASEEFSWYSSFNISTYRNEVTDLGGEAFRWVGTDIMHSGPTHRLEVGEPVAYFYGYEWDGIYQNEDQLHENSPTNYVGGWKYVDHNNDGVINSDDRRRIGNPHPDFFGGFTNRFSYKGFDLSISTSFKYGNDILNFNNLSSTMPTGGGNVYKGFTNYWDGENSTDQYAKPSTRRSQMFSSRMLEDGSYFKISNLRLTYNFPNIATLSQSIRRLSIYINMSNYFTFTDYNGYDPEVSFQGITNLAIGEDFSQYPRTKSISAGINLTF